MNNKEFNATLDYIISREGYDHQSRMLIEEMSELTQAINKFWRYNLDKGARSITDEYLDLDNEYTHNLVEEMADVYICLAQMSRMLNCEASVDIIAKAKINRYMANIQAKEASTITF